MGAAAGAYAQIRHPLIGNDRLVIGALGRYDGGAVQAPIRDQTMSPTVMFSRMPVLPQKTISPDSMTTSR